MTGHSLAFADVGRCGAGAVGTLMTVELGTVGHGSSVLAVSSDRALIAFALGDGSDIDLVAFGEDVSLDLVFHTVISRVFKAELSDVTFVRDLCFVMSA